MPLVALVVGFALSLAQDSEGPAVDLGGPLVVGEVVIPEKEIKRYLIYGPGRAELEYYRVQAEVILLAALDFPGFHWKQDGWRVAEEEAERLFRELAGSPEAWAQSIDLHSELWEPPPVAGKLPRRKPPWEQQNGGRFGHLSRDSLRHLLGESEYSEFLNGWLLADEIFFGSPVDSIVGPFEGPWGYYLIKVLERTPPEHELKLDRDRSMMIFRDEWIRLRFVEYAHEALRSTEVRGSLERR